MKIKISPLKTATLQNSNAFVFHNVHWFWIKFTRNINKVKWQMAHWNKKLLTSRRWDVRSRVRQFLFCKKSVECGEKKLSAKNCKSYNNSALKTANLLKIHRFHRIHRKKMRELCGENYLFFTAILTLFFDQTSTWVMKLM